MPVPNAYKNMASRLKPFQRNFFYISLAGILVSFISIVLSVQLKLNLMMIHGIGFLMALWGWGLFLVITWYGTKSKIAGRLPDPVNQLFKWTGCLFLNLWFIFGTVWILLFVFSPA